MDTRAQNVINSNRELIIKDLHGDVFEDLFAKGDLSLQEYDEIISMEGQDIKNGKLLEILVNKNDGLEKLMEALKEWYWWIVDSLKKSLEENQLCWEAAIAHTNIPPISSRNVSRRDLLGDVRSALKKLKNGHYVILHGMSGCGKSSLAAEALHDDILINSFEGKVHWLKCSQDTESQLEGDDGQLETLGLQIELNARICDDEMVSDVQTVSENTVARFRTLLMKRLELSGFKKGLIVLDGVNSSKVLEALNIGCKTLVTTTDLEVAASLGNRSFLIKVDEGFKENESMELLAKCVDLPADQLPAQAKQIHFHSKGHPLMMSLIGGQVETNQEELKNNKEKWNRYVEVLSNKNYGGMFKRKSQDMEVLPGKNQTMDLCINSLNEEMRKRYQDFALFVEDVNIKTKVLEILWKLPEHEVKDIMDDFHKKSLIVRKYNPIQNSYVYGIHDLLLYHLKKKLKENELQELHLKLIKCYEEYCKGDLSKLPRDDNYFFYYIGYHIANAKVYNLFTQWYFDLDFIEGKLKAAGPGDLLLDYKRYSAHFKEGSAHDEAKISSKLTDFERFVEHCGSDVKKDDGLDMIQLALQEPHESEVYRSALRYTSCLPHPHNRTYLHFQLGPSKSRSAPVNVPFRESKGEKVSCACFSKNYNDLIVAYESGTIQLMNSKGYVKRTYRGHDSCVRMLAVSSPLNIFLSVSDNCVNIWKFPDLEDCTSPDPENRTPSPQQRQDDFTPIFNKRTEDSATSWHSIDSLKHPIWACFSSNGLQIATCSTQEQRLQVWEMNARGKFLQFTINVSATSCIFSYNDKVLIVGSSTSYILMYNAVNTMLLSKTQVSYPVLSLFTLPGLGNKERFGVLTKATLCVWEMHSFSTSSGRTNYHHQVKASEGESDSYTCCSAAPDGSIVAVAKTSGKVDICDVNTGQLLRQITDLTQNMKYWAVNRWYGEHVLLGCNSEGLRLWSLGAELTSFQVTMRPNFEVTWTPSNEPVLVAPTSRNYFKLIVEKSKVEDVMVDSDSPTKLCAISRNGQYMVTITTANEVFIYKEVPKSSKPILLHFEENKKSNSIRKVKIEVLQGYIVWVLGYEDSMRVCHLKETSKKVNKPPSKIDIALQVPDQLENFYILSYDELLFISKGCSIQSCYIGSKKHGELSNDVSNTEGVMFEEENAPGEDWQVSLSHYSGEKVCDTDLKGDILAVLKEENKPAGLKWSLRCFNLDKCSEEKSIMLDEMPSCCRFSVNGRKFAVGFKSGVVQVYNCIDWSESQVLHKCGGEVLSVCVSDNGEVYAAVPGRVVLRTPSGHHGQARLNTHRLIMSPDNRTVITVDLNGHLHLIDQLKPKPASRPASRLVLKSPKHKKHLSLP